MQHSHSSLGGTAATAFVILLSMYASLSAQDQTVGLITYDLSSLEGYTLFTPNISMTTYLIDNYGRLVHSWDASYPPALSVYLLENGSLLRTRSIGGPGGSGAGFQQLAWDGTVLWEYEYFSVDHRQHHDIEPLPNGNVLVLAQEYRTAVQAIAAGRDPSLLANDVLNSEHIIEVQPTGPTSGDIVWEWHIWDHLIQDFDSSKANFGTVADHPELLDINFAIHARAEWIHLNSVAYNHELDQIVVSSRNLGEIWVIDHSTTTVEAAGHDGGNSGMGGDILYRWGNPQAYRRGTAVDQRLFVQHDAHWIASGLPGEGNILIFNNGEGRPDGDYSSVDEIVPPVDSTGHYAIAPNHPYEPQVLQWTYVADDPTDFFAQNISGARRLPNGNTLICSGPQGIFFEVTASGETVWKYVNPATSKGMLVQGEVPSGNSVFRCHRYTADFPGLDGHDLTPNGTLEIYPISFSGTSHSPSTPSAFDWVDITTTITDDREIITSEVHVDTGDGIYFTTEMYDDGNHHDGAAGDDLYGSVIPPLHGSGTVSYYIIAENDSGSATSDPPIAPATAYSYTVSGGSSVCGDADASGEVDIDDVVYLITYIFSGGPAPDPLESGDTDCSGGVDIDDVVYLIAYIFSGGNAPCNSDGDGVPNC